jgi:hypothetical protein
LNSWSGGNPDRVCLAVGSGDEKGLEGELGFRERAFQMDFEQSFTQQPGRKAHDEPAIAQLPVVNSLSANVGHCEALDGREFDAVDSGASHFQVDRVADEEAMVFDTGVNPRRNVDGGLDTPEPELEIEGARVESIRCYGPVRGIYLPESGQVGGLDQHVFGGEGQGATFTVDAPGLGKVDGEERFVGAERPFRKESQAIGSGNRF